MREAGIEKMKYKLIGYVKLRDLKEMPEADVNALDVMNISFGYLKEGRVGLQGKEEYQEDMKRVRNINPNIKIVLSIGGWSAGGFSTAVKDQRGRDLFVTSAVETIKDWDLDGIDIDWEYPCIGIAGIDWAKEDKENFTYLMQGLREGMNTLESSDRHYIVSIAAGGDAYFTRCTQMDQVEKYLDYVQLMTYDLRGGFNTATGHHTGLYSNPEDLFEVCTDKAVKSFIEAGVPTEKLVIGAAFYSRIWKGVPDRNHGLMQAAKSTGGYGPGYGELIDKFENKNGYIRYWDEEAKAPYLFNGENFISYDDKESLTHKAEYVKAKGLCGIMYWEYCLDTKRELTQFLREKLR